MSKPKIKYTCIEQYPSILEPIHIQAILDIGERQTYELLNLEPAPFHIVRVGRLIKVAKHVFVKWLEEGTEFEIIQSDSKGIPLRFKYKGREYVYKAS